MKKHKLDLELVLPNEGAGCDACVARLVDTVGATRGIVGVHVDRDDSLRPKLCLHYDPGRCVSRRSKRSSRARVPR